MHIVYTDRHKLHATDHIRRGDSLFVTEEVPARAETILHAVQAEQLGPVVAPTDHGLAPILAVHDVSFVEFLSRVYAECAEHYGKPAPVFAESFATRHIRRKPDGFLGLLGYYAFGDDTPILEGTWNAAYWSAQCAATAADLVQSAGGYAYALCRPPGHHAAADLYGGVCYLNNAAIATRYLQQLAQPPTLSSTTQEAANIAILDIDYHHGNGTQEIFYTDPSVLYCSLHTHPDTDYPFYWGDSDERGEGPGQGLNCNWPLPPGTDDVTYLAALEEALAVIREFEPRYLVVSAGFDITAGDPWGGFRVTPDGLREIGARIAALGLPGVIVQEGGYRLDTLGQNAAAFLRMFA